MLFSSVVLIVCLMSSLRDFHVSSCDYNCADKPVFTPSSLVVKHGDPTSATCVPCHNSCQNIVSGLEHAQGVKTENGTKLVWTVDRVTEWDSKITCYYTGDKQCCTDLPVTVYQPPEHVSISFVDHTGPMIEGHQYQLQCTVKNVAPVKHLVVTFYRGETALDQLQSISSDNYKPVTETFTLNITASKEHDGAQYRCEAKLELGSEGPQPPPVVKSENITATVYYGPKLLVSANENIKITAGDTLRLNCSSEGNPRPSYSWKLPAERDNSSFSNNVLIIQSVRPDQGGNYVCNVSNEVETVTVNYYVIVQAPPEHVSISFVDHNGSMTEGLQYQLQCTVKNVAPVKDLVVTFYRGETALDQLQSIMSDNYKPVTETFTLNITASKEHDGAQYWCEAKLELGPEGPQPPPVVKSENITATVYYGPKLLVSANETITITVGDTLHLNCSTEGNPRPSYSWKLPAERDNSSFNGSVLTIQSVGSDQGGNYVCNVSNQEGTVTVYYYVDIQANIIPYIIGGVIAAVVLITLITGYIQYKEHYRTGKYNLKAVFNLHTRHVPLPSEG